MDEETLAHAPWKPRHQRLAINSGGRPLCVAPGISPGPEDSSFLTEMITEMMRHLPDAMAHKQIWGVCWSHFTVNGEPQFKSRPPDELCMLGGTTSWSGEFRSQLPMGLQVGEKDMVGMGR